MRSAEDRLDLWLSTHECSLNTLPYSLILLLLCTLHIRVILAMLNIFIAIVVFVACTVNVG